MSNINSFIGIRFISTHEFVCYENQIVIIPGVLTQMKFNEFMKLNRSKMMLLDFLNLDLKFSIFFSIMKVGYKPKQYKLQL